MLMNLGVSSLFCSTPGSEISQKRRERRRENYSAGEEKGDVVTSSRFIILRLLSSAARCRQLLSASSDEMECLTNCLINHHHLIGSLIVINDRWMASASVIACMSSSVEAGNVSALPNRCRNHPISYSEFPSDLRRVMSSVRLSTRGKSLASNWRVPPLKNDSTICVV